MNDHTKRQIARVAHMASLAAHNAAHGFPTDYVPEGMSFEENETSAIQAVEYAIEQNFTAPLLNDEGIRRAAFIVCAVAKEMTAQNS